MLGQQESSGFMQTKWDGAPSVVCGVDPLSGVFFVGTKSVFNKTEPKLCATESAVDEYSPKKIKMAITGSGNASKEQVAKMLQSLLKIKELPKNLDATDGLAAAVCHFFNQGRPEKTNSYSGWQAYVSQNPNKIKSD